MKNLRVPAPHWAPCSLGNLLLPLYVPSVPNPLSKSVICVFFSLLWLQNGDAAASLTVAEQYVSAFSKLAKDSNTILLPSNPGDVTSMVAQVRCPEDPAQHQCQKLRPHHHHHNLHTVEAFGVPRDLDLLLDSVENKSP